MKLRPAAEAQQSGMSVLERVVSDVLGHFPWPAPKKTAAPRVYLLVGSERGFCGAFNENVWKTADADGPADRASVRIVLAGARMALRYGDDPRVALTLAMPARPHEMTGALKDLQPLLRGRGAARADFVLVYNEETGAGLETRLVRPFARLLRREPLRYPYPPLLHEPPAGFLMNLADEYLARLLSYVFLTSSIAENRQRARQLEGAVREIDRRLDSVRFRLNAAAQEATTEEIEEIMLGVMALL